MIRFFDIVISILAVLLFFVPSFFIALIIFFDDGFPILFKQQRVGKSGKLFFLYKFRTMRNSVGKEVDLTAGENAKRITKSGRWIRSYKLDELPQIINVLLGDMSIVGPRPEVPYFVSMYDQKQMEVLEVKPGITDWASIEYKNENEILSEVEDPLQHYIQFSIPKKIELNRIFINNPSVFHYFRIIFMTLRSVVKK